MKKKFILFLTFFFLFTGIAGSLEASPRYRGHRGGFSFFQRNKYQRRYKRYRKTAHSRNIRKSSTVPKDYFIHNPRHFKVW
ncbi:MAG: hypothetical protein NTU44_04040 [Bacteroidetes bacterium]|nr:hypothetical protein [Bacteroidota bacterium]